MDKVSSGEKLTIFFDEKYRRKRNHFIINKLLCKIF